MLLSAVSCPLHFYRRNVGCCGGLGCSPKDLCNLTIVVVVVVFSVPRREIKFVPLCLLSSFRVGAVFSTTTVWGCSCERTHRWQTAVWLGRNEKATVITSIHSSCTVHSLNSVSFTHIFPKWIMMRLRWFVGMMRRVLKGFRLSMRMCCVGLGHPPSFYPASVSGNE